MKKIIFLIVKIFLILPFKIGKHRLYMAVYYRILKLIGLNFEGIPRYIGYNVKFDNPKLIYLGPNIVISDECVLLTHDYSLTTVLRYKNKYEGKDIAVLRKIIIGKNCFIGKRTIIMPNTIIGDNCIIGAGSVVRGNVENGSILIGNPAIKTMNIDELDQKWTNIKEDLIRKD